MKNKKPKLSSPFIKIFCGILVLFLLFGLYNLIVSRDEAPKSDMEIEQEIEQKALRDTFDVVGDYLFPNQKADMEDLITDAEKESAKNGDKDKENGSTATIVNDGAEDEFIESADVSSDTKPVQTAPEANTPTSSPSVEKLESPKITPIE